MNEHETDPQRPEAPTTGQPSHQPADASPEGTSPQRGQSETAAHPTVGPPAAPPQWQPPTPQPPTPQPSAPWQQPGHPQQQPAHPGYSQQQRYGQQQYDGQQQYAYPGQQQPQYTTQHGWTTPETQPAWAVPVGGEPQQDRPRGNGGGRRILVGSAVAVLIALGAGGVGAATALAFHDDGTSPVKTANSSVTRVVDRSSLADIASSVRDSVVSITTQSGEGSGVILTTDGSILTNNHVVATATGGTVQVIFANGKKVPASIVGTDPRTDLAVVKASGVSGLTAATLGDSAKMQVGDTVLAIGSPLGLEGSVTQGIISAKDRTIQSSGEQQQQPNQPDPFGRQQQPQTQSGTSTTLSGLLQTDAPINPGNSGGALVNINGEVIGINSAIATSGSTSGNIGLGFAIPSNKAKTVYEALAAGKKVSHAALGVSVTEAEGGGALVRSVTSGSAAAKAGLQQGDVIKSVNGTVVNDSDGLVGIIQAANVGDEVTVVFTRSGSEKTVTATLAEAP